MKKNNNKYKKCYFEGWYFKQQTNDYSIAFIPGINIDNRGNRYAFIQVITEEESYNINYDFKDFSISDDGLTIRIANNIFSTNSSKINIENKDITIKGKLTYKNITKIKKDIMGPFAFFPFMECVHGILSINHKVSGILEVNNKEIKFLDDIGYIEKDSGKSFPENYLWVQCNHFSVANTSIMASIADIPFLGFKFKGCIAIVYYRGKEYRLATYNGAKIIKYNEKQAIIKKGIYRLEIDINWDSPKKLLAPNVGEMKRTINENISCNASFKFYKKNKLIFDLYSDKASFEYVIS